MRLTSKKSSIRRDTLAWLEQAARSREPDAMQLRSHTELLPIVQVGTAAAASTHAHKWPVGHRPALAQCSEGCHAAQVSHQAVARYAGGPSCPCQCACTQWSRLHAPALAPCSECSAARAAAGVCCSKQLRQTDRPAPAGSTPVVWYVSCSGMSVSQKQGCRMNFDSDANAACRQRARPLRLLPPMATCRMSPAWPQPLPQPKPT